MIIKNKFYHPKQIERVAYSLLVEYYNEDLPRIRPPIEIDKILEIHLDLNVLWDKFNDSDILAGLIPIEKKVVLNEDLLSKFNSNKGLENFTKAHEVGHWFLHVDHASQFTKPLPGFKQPYEMVCRDTNKDWDEKNADKFASYLLMPEVILTSKLESKIEGWPFIYKLAEEFEVSVSAMKNRLINLERLYVDEDGKFHTTKAEAQGQMVMM